MASVSSMSSPSGSGRRVARIEPGPTSPLTSSGGQPTLDQVEERLRFELNGTLERVRQTDCGVGSERPAAGVWEDPTGDEQDEQADAALLDSDREMNFVRRSLLIERAQRLADALERLSRGDYGICQECGEFIPSRRLQVLPEVSTCVRCQERLERTARRHEPWEIRRPARLMDFGSS